MKHIFIGIFSIFLNMMVGGKDTMASLTLNLQSSAFKQGESTPAKYTCDGEGVSLPLSWEGVPEGTKSFVLIIEDPDARGGETWDHWVLFNIPPTTRELKENSRTLPVGTKIGVNSWQKTEYGGPCPPNGAHRYVFHLMALDALLDLPWGATKQEILKASKGHGLARTELMGKYERKKG